MNTLKKFPPLRPIVSDFNCVSANLSECFDCFLKYQSKTCKSHMRDTTDMKLKSLFTVPSTSILVTMDVNSLYTNIDQEEGSDACYKKLETHKNKSAPWKTLKDCILLILKSNISVLWYSSSTKKGDMGSPVATNYVNLFMRIFETSLQNKFYKKKTKKKTGKETLNIATFHPWHVFCLDRWWRLVERVFSVFARNAVKQRMWSQS